jgi:hypothetical protein
MYGGTWHSQGGGLGRWACWLLVPVRTIASTIAPYCMQVR